MASLGIMEQYSFTGGRQSSLVISVFFVCLNDLNFFLILFTYLAAPGLSCGMQDLVP